MSRYTILLSVTLLLVYLPINGNAQQDDEVINVESSLVVVNAAVQDNRGRHVSGLRKDQFTVLEDGNPQPIAFFAAEETPFAAVILLDTSGSIGENLPLVRAAAINFLDQLRPDDVASIYNFESRVKLIQDFSNRRDISQKIYDLRSDGMTALNDAIFTAAKSLESRPEKRRAIIVLSDGADTSSGRSADKALRAALEANAVIYTVDMSTPAGGLALRQQSQAALKRFAEKSGGIFVSTPGGAALREAFAKISDDLGIQYTLGYYPTEQTRDGKWHAIELRIARPNLSIRTRRGYMAEKPK